jgi:hypothetical protein
VRVHLNQDATVSDFVFLFRIGPAEQREAMGSPERAQQSMEAWMAWMRDLETNGHLTNRGQPLDRVGKVVRGSAKVVTDGPYVEVKDMVAGYIVVSARDIDQATELASTCPMLAGGGSVEVRPVMAMNG